jgi:glutathione S-transferase
MARLVAISYSPWSERARWALDHHRLPYEEVAYTPMLGEPWLRTVARRPVGRVTVPFYQDGETRLYDSRDIAVHADREGKGSPLFPPGGDAEIDRWLEASEQVAAGGRALATSRVTADPEARREALPPIIPEGLLSAMTPLASVGAVFLASKYGFGASSDAGARSQIREGLNALREGLGGASSGPRHLVGGTFTFADVAMATAMQFVTPVPDLYISLGPATRRCFTQQDLSEEYADLLAWRDDLYASFRK